MCYHIFLAAGPEELARHFGRKADLIRNLRPPLRACAFSHLPYPVLTGDEQIRYSRWGLIPYWLRRPEDVVTVRNQTVNAVRKPFSKTRRSGFRSVRDGVWFP